MTIGTAENEIVGRWIIQDGKTVADSNCERIARLTSSYLIPLADDPTGWKALFQDPSDKSLWERVYPESEIHGGGPPQLRRLSLAEALANYAWSPTEITK